MRRRILAAVLVMTVLAVAAFFVPAALSIRNAQRRGELLELQRQASIVATQLAAPGFEEQDALDSIAESNLRLGLYAPDGRLLGGSGPTQPDRIVRLALQGNFAEGYIGEDLVAAVPVSASATHSALVIRIEAPSSDSRGRYLRSLALLGSAALAIIAAAATVGAWVSRRLNRPIDELTAWAGSAATPGLEPPAPTGITEIDALRSALVDGRARIEELLRRERSFSSQVSHQLRTPVAAMRVAIETEIEAPRQDRSIVLRESLEQLERLESTISSLLALARHSDRPHAECDLLALARDQVQHWCQPAAISGRELVVDGESITAEVDADAVRHIIDVLIDNAVRHGTGRIEVRVGRAGSGANIDVADAGRAPLVNDPFAEVGSDSSHGIGLRLARALAESCQGRLELVDHATTTFRLTLPT